MARARVARWGCGMTRRRYVSPEQDAVLRAALLRRQEDEANLATWATEHGTTPEAIRKVRAEQKAATAEAARARQLDIARALVTPPPPRARGRSRWTATLFAERWAAACLEAGEPYTYPRVCEHFRQLDGTIPDPANPDYLGRLWRKWGRPGPYPVG